MLPDYLTPSIQFLDPPGPGQVRLRELLESLEWQTTLATLPMALGRSDSGEPLIADLAELPHLLIGGATGSGKSVALHGILLSLLCRFHPNDLRLVLVDSGRVEMQLYNSFPHLLIPTVTEVAKVALVMRWLLGEMRKRQRLLARANIRDLGRFNTRPPHTDVLRDYAGGLALPATLPRIVVVIDDLSDLAEVATDELQQALALVLGQGGATGIHLILSSQIPGLKIIEGAMKFHPMGRLAFDVSSEADSRLFLDQSGAEGLRCNGDFVYQPTLHAELRHGQTAYVSEEEIQRWKQGCSG